MGKAVKRVLAVLLTIILLVVVVVGCYIAYLMITYNRIADKQPIDIENNVAEVALQVDQEYTATTYNIGFGAYTPDYTFFMDEGIMEDGTTDSYYSPVTEAHFNCFANGMLNISGFMAGLYNVFDLEKNELKYDAAKKAAEIEAVGEIPYEVFASVASRELYDRNNAGWFSVSIAKGLTTAEALVRLFAFCRPFFVNGKNSTAA